MSTAETLPTILIVEDDEVLGEVLTRVLTGHDRVGRHVRTAGEALRLVEEGCPRLVLVDAGLRDAGLADGTGLKLAESLRAISPRLPVIVLSTHRLEKSDLPGRGEQLVTKSIDLPELRRTIDAALLESPATDLETARNDSVDRRIASRRPSMRH